MKSSPSKILQCPLHDVIPECELVVVRKAKTVKYSDPSGKEASYRIKGIRYYRIRCRKCFYLRRSFKCSSAGVKSSEEHVLACGVVGKSKADAAEKWNSAVGDMQVRRLIDITKGEEEKKQ